MLVVNKNDLTSKTETWVREFKRKFKCNVFIRDDKDDMKYFELKM